LLLQQGVGALQLFVTQQQALNALGEIIDFGHGEHCRRA
jgi:hypothetical protein